MFKESTNARTMLRALVATGIAVGFTLKASIGDGLDSQEWVDLFLAGFGSIGAYLGIGAAIPQMEPFFGKQLEDAEVPIPPATPED